MAEHVSKQLTAALDPPAGLLFSENMLESVLDAIVSFAHETVPKTAGAGITLVRYGKNVSAAYSDELVKAADIMQYELDQGPCLAASRHKRSYRIDSMRDDDRWPLWSCAAAAVGMNSSLSVPLIVRGESLGAIKVYSMTPAAYDERDERILSMLANQAAAILANVGSFMTDRQLSEQLRDALEVRQVIGEAVGMLMEREGIDEETAFAVLRRASQKRNLNVRELAREVLATRRLDGAEPRAADAQSN